MAHAPNLRAPSTRGGRPTGNGLSHRAAWWLPLAAALLALVWLAPATDGHAQGPAPSSDPKPVATGASAGTKPAPSATGNPSAAAMAEPTDAAASSADGGDRPGSDDAATDADPEVSALRAQAERIEALLVGELDPAVEPSTLFTVDLTDETAVRLEARRLRTLIDAVDAKLAAADGGPDGAAPAASARRPGGPPHAPAAMRPGPDAGYDAGDGGADPDAEPPASEPALSEELWRAQVALDRARLAFYELAGDERDALLDAHAERARASKEAEQQRQISEADEKARNAAAEREKALAAMRLARTEATRLVAEERARLLGVAQSQASYEKELIVLEHSFGTRQEALLAWRRRVGELTGSGESGSPPAENVERADRTYDELRRQLRANRQELGEALRALEEARSDVPGPGPDPLVELPADVDRGELDGVREKVLATERELRGRESAYRAAHARQLMDEVATLNRQRLELLALLSEPKRESLVGFGEVGRDQARAEVSQVWLVLRFQQWDTTSSLAERWRQGLVSRAALGLTPRALVWLVPVLGFVWWRRRAPAAIDRWRRLAQQAHERRTRRRTPSRIARAIELFGRVRRPLEWLLLLVLATLLLPDSVRQRLEARILGEVLFWSFGAMLVIRVVDALASGQPPASGRTDPGPLRLRSLRLVGLVVVAFALLLRLAAEMVGEGTIYTWVFRTCWFAALPVVVVLVAWWRPVIFERLAPQQRRSPLAAWVTARRDSWSSFFAAAVGGVYLVVSRVGRKLRRWLGGFELTRRALAYWFHREMAKQAATEPERRALEPLPERAARALDPEKPSTAYVSCPADAEVRTIVELIEAHGGGIFAVVGERGAGKSSILRRIAADGPDVRYVECPHGGLDAVRARLAASLGLGPEASLETIRARLDRVDHDHGIVLDDAHRLMRPEIGGLDELDALLDFARRASASCTWVLALDAVIWQLFERGRGARPAFDDVIHVKHWSEQEIGALLARRTEQARLEPSYELVMPPMPERADELDREEARARARSSYVRLVWDHANGNPGVALQLWRDSLRVTGEGRTLVRLFEVPSPSDLESLPDEAVFVLRAVLQLDRARAEELAAATTLSPSEVASALRYGMARGYFERLDGRYRTAWPWFRTITRFLERRHLLMPVGRP